MAHIQFPFSLIELEQCWNEMDKNSNVKMYNADRDLSKENATSGKGGPTGFKTIYQYTTS